MNYRKFKADQLFDGYRFRENDSVLITDETGKFEAIVNAGEAGEEVENFRGILSPGLINCHCHLELSHMKDVIPPHTGLIEFLCTVVTKREAQAPSQPPPKGEGFEDPSIRKMHAIVEAEKEMFNNGIVAVGDIGNTADTANTKSTSKIYWQNFVEVLGFTDERAEENIAYYKTVAQTFEDTLSKSDTWHLTPGTRYRTSLVPHAPYSISPKTFRLINEATKGQIISIHNQEHPAEDELYKTGGGDYLKLFKIFGLDHSPFPVTGKSSVRSVLPYFNNGQTIFLVHNSYMPEEDILFANEYAEANGLKLVYCLCPNANLYIENKVPPVELFIKHNCHIVLGTDSYSSNWQLSIVKEMQSIKKNLPQVKTEDLLRWATLEGARALQWDNQLGSFEKGKTPGIVLIENDLSGSQRLLD
jgi:cytosine/adenosine deaminase-related metal-dependent hydrolase